VTGRKGTQYHIRSTREVCAPYWRQLHLPSRQVRVHPLQAIPLQKDYNKAKEHADKAVKILFPVEPGEDSGFAKYCYACVLLDTNGHSKPTIKEIENYFRGAKSDDPHDHNSGLSILTPHAAMRLAQLYLGSTHYAAGSSKNEENVCATENLLKTIDPEIMTVHSRCYFYLTKSDLYRCKGIPQESKAAAQQALDLAEQYNFTNEIESAKNRLSAGHTPS